MSFYTESVTIRSEGDSWRLVSKLVWEIGREGSGLIYEVAPGMTTDLATVPWWASALFRSSDARYAKASILHDAMLADRFAPATAAAEFAEALRADRVSKWRAMIMGLAVLVHTTRHDI